jgi:hypothetical protein
MPCHHRVFIGIGCFAIATSVSAQSINATGTWLGTWSATSCNASGGLRGVFTHNGASLTGGLTVLDFFLQGNPQALGALSGTLNDQGFRLTGQFRVGFGPDPTVMFADFTVQTLRDEQAGSVAFGTYVIPFQSFCPSGTWTLRLARSLGTAACLPRLEADGSLIGCETIASGGPGPVLHDRVLDLPLDAELTPGNVRLQTEAGAGARRLGASTRLTLDNAPPFISDFATFPFGGREVLISTVHGSASARLTDTLRFHNGVGEGRLVLPVKVTGTFLFDYLDTFDPFGVLVQNQSTNPSISVNGSPRFMTFPGGPFGVPQAGTQTFTYSLPFVFGEPLLLDMRLFVRGENGTVTDRARIPGDFLAPGYFTDLRLSHAWSFDLRHTAEIETATVTDASGSPLPGVTVTTESGETYGLPPEPVLQFDFTGFIDPIENPPAVNAVKAGRSIPVKFSLGGDHGLQILAAGYPNSQQVTCDTAAAVNDVEETGAAGSSDLQYDPIADEYRYVWKTSAAWANTCRQLIVGLTDGSLHRADFRFK